VGTRSTKSIPMVLDQPGPAEVGHNGVEKPRLRSWGTKALRHFRAQFRLLRREHASPARVGVAVGVGVLLGCSPFLGVQVLTALVLARLLHLNRIAILLGVQISIPPLTPLVLFVTAQVGALLVRGHWLPLRLASFRGLPTAQLLASLFVDMLVGGFVVGGLLALVLGTASAVGLGWSSRARLAAHPRHDARPA
jgi:uncharacterized protein (DUF2062 family)